MTSPSRPSRSVPRLLAMAALLILALPLQLPAQDRDPDAAGESDHDHAAAADDADRGILGIRHPAISPDGTEVAFSYRGDIWIAPIGGGRATRVTSHPACEEHPAWHPHGHGLVLAFTSDERGTQDIVVALRTGGKRIVVTQNGCDDARPAFSHDGRFIYFQSRRDSNMDLCYNESLWDLWRVPTAGGTARRITHFRGQNPDAHPGGERIAFSRYGSGYADGEHDIHIVGTEGGVPRTLASAIADQRYPKFTQRNLYWIANANGIHHNLPVDNIWGSPANGGAHFQVTDFHDGSIGGWDVADDSSIAVVERDYRLELVDMESGRHHPIAITIDGNPYESVENEPVPAEIPGQIAETAVLSLTDNDDDGRTLRLLFTFGNGLRVATLQSRRDGDGSLAIPEFDQARGVRHPQWPDVSPDGRWLAVCEGRGEHNQTGDTIRIHDLQGEHDPITVAEGESYRCLDFAPDSSRLVYTVRTEDGGRIEEINLATRETVKLVGQPEGNGIPLYAQYLPVVSRLLYVVSRPSGRGYNSDIMLLNREANTVVRVPLEHNGLIRHLQVSPDGKQLAFAIPGGRGGDRLVVHDLLAGESRTLEANVSCAYPRWLDNEHLVAAATSRGDQGVALFTLTDDGSRLATRPLARTQSVKRRELHQQTFDAMLQLFEDRFYDPFLHGVDWQGRGDFYRPVAAQTSTTRELYDLMTRLILELDSSHVHVELPPISAPVTGMPGWEVIQQDDGSLKVIDVIPNGPADQAGIGVGDVVTAVNGEALQARTNFDALTTRPPSESDEPGTDSLLEGGGRLPRSEPDPDWTVTLTVRKESADEAGEVGCGLYTRTEIRQLRYENQIAERREFVRRRSNGRLVYHHIQTMLQADLREFSQAVPGYRENAEGLVLDIRDGIGGNIHHGLAQALDSTAARRLAGRPACHIRGRGRRSQADAVRGPYGRRYQGSSWDKPSICVMNNICRSDKEIFPHLYRHLGLGTLVGEPSARGVIGSGYVGLPDGGTCMISSNVFFTSKGVSMEGNSVVPDVIVEETLADLYAGRDRQLETAVDLILAQMDGKMPFPERYTVDDLPAVDEPAVPRRLLQGAQHE